MRRIPRTQPTRPAGRRRAARQAARREKMYRLGGVAAILFVALTAGALLLSPQTTLSLTGLDSPTTPRVSETSGTMLRVSWRPVTYSDYYKVTARKANQGAKGKVVEAVKVDGTEAQLAHLAPGTKYRIEVKAVDVRQGKSALTSDPSDPAIATTTARSASSLLVPTSPTVIEARNTTLTIGWEPIDTAGGYDVEYATNPKFDGSHTVHSDSRSATIQYLDAATAYFVRVRATGTNDARSDWTQPLTAKTIQPTDPLPLAVASYNVKCHSCGGPSWSSRREGVAATIASRGLDVVGLQEAQQSGGPQFDDLLRVLNQVQPGWALTNRDVNGTLGDRLIYNTKRIRLVKEGGGRYHHQGNGREYHQRYFVWGMFIQRSSGKRFLFFSTHLDPDSVSARIEQAGELAKIVATMRGNLPAIVVGDMNASQYHVYDVHRELSSAGLVDPLGVLPSSHAVGPGATVERRINTNYDSFNNFASRPSVSAGANGNGTYIDYIFTTPMRVIEFENVVNLDSQGHYRRAASDHNMIRAIVGLP